jgi:steroid 5-alpha reductase family enzyme
LTPTAILSNPFVLAALGWAAAAACMTIVWLAQLRLRNVGVLEPVRTALIGALAILYASLARQGALGRRVAIASMMGSWGVQLAIYMWYGRNADRERAWSFGVCQRQALIAAFLSLPALLPAINPEPELSPLEYAAAGLWLVGFAGEAAVERRRLAPPAAAADVAPDAPTPPPRRAWRLPARLFDWMVWIAFALFALASPYGWIACAPAGWVLARRAPSPQPSAPSP